MPSGIYERKLVDPAERFWTKVDKNGPISPSDGTRCWIWNAGTNQFGYGLFWHQKRMLSAHRFAYENLIEEVPAGLQLDHRHTCPKVCVNPDHLRPVTTKQNSENRAGPYSNSTSGVRGVTWFKRDKRWRAQVMHNGRGIHVGYYDTILEAEQAVVAKRLELFTHNDADRMVD